MNENDSYAGWPVMAVQFDGDNLTDLVKYLPGAKSEIVYAPHIGPMGSTRKCASVWTTQNSAVVPVGSWLVVWQNGRFRSMSDNDFSCAYITEPESRKAHHHE